MKILTGFYVLCIALVLGALFWWVNVSVHALVSRDWMLYAAPPVSACVFALLAHLADRALTRGGR